jgi:thiol-disulfide isomerase/thioredoxin
MRGIWLIPALAITGMAQPSLVNAVRRQVGQQDLAGAERTVREWQKTHAASAEIAAALSWLARGSLQARNLDRADSFAGEAYEMASRFLAKVKLDDDSWLPTAAGAAVEVHAQVLAARGDRAAALNYLEGQARRFEGTSLVARIRKNINLLGLEGHPAPALTLGNREWLGARPPSLASLKGHPVILFFWAHWCPDCKAQAPVLAKLRRTFAASGLVVMAPTRLYGVVAQGEDAPPARERTYIEEIHRTHYAALGDAPVPMSDANFNAYGASTTPTIVLIDKAGIVRLYHPGAMGEAELAARIRSLPR